jgi:ferredoxin-NADP reductase
MVTGTARHAGGKVLLVAGGAGIRPMRGLFRSLSGAVTLIYLVRTAGQVLFADELAALADRPGRRLHILLGSGRFSTAGLRLLVPDAVEHHAYVCGPTGLVTDAMAALHGAGVSVDRIQVLTL